MITVKVPDPTGYGRILRDALRAHLPEALLHDTESELLIATTHAGRYARALFPRPAPHKTSKAGLVIHSNRERTDLHEVIVASCYIPVLYAGVSRIDGEVHVDGAVAEEAHHHRAPPLHLARVSGRWSRQKARPGILVQYFARRSGTLTG